MELQFKQEYLSIKEFTRINLPNFTILTGLNGSGKSHLLEAIENHRIVINDINQPLIVRFNYESFRLDNEKKYSAQQLENERKSAWTFCENQIISSIKKWHSQLGDDYELLKNKCIEDNISFWQLANQHIVEYKNIIKSILYSSGIREKQETKGVLSIIKSIPYSIVEMSYDNFITLYKSKNYKNDFLPDQLGKIFWDYYVRYMLNQDKIIQNEKFNKNYEYLTDNEFTKKYGEKPWWVINDILLQFGTIPYKVNSPEGLNILSTFQLRLSHIEKEGIEIDFNNLSSGERVLMALVSSIYNSIGNGKLNS